MRWGNTHFHSFSEFLPHFLECIALVHEDINRSKGGNGYDYLSRRRVLDEYHSRMPWHQVGDTAYLDLGHHVAYIVDKVMLYDLLSTNACKLQLVIFSFFSFWKSNQLLNFFNTHVIFGLFLVIFI